MSMYHFSIFILYVNKLFIILQREYEEFRVRINSLVAKAKKVPEEGWTMQDGTPWPGNNICDHPGMIQVSNSQKNNIRDHPGILHIQIRCVPKNSLV
jgi:hypothetical protein